jgi:TrpR family trp operon transcriptional repressor
MKNIKELARIISEIEDAQLIEEFLYSILTKNEIENVSSRWEIVKRLEKGISQRKIAKSLHLSLCKITRGSRELKKENSPIKKILTLYRNVIRN